MDSGAPLDESVRFYSGAVRRILRILLVLSLVVPMPVWHFYGLAAAAGLFLGSLVSWLNFQSLSRSVEGLADRIVDAHSRERGMAVVMRFLLRYVFVGIVAYVIFRGSSQAFRGFLFGLCLPVAAMLCEAAVEAYAALRRGY